MAGPTLIAALAVAFGAALIGGIFFAFSNFVMRALGRMDAAGGIAAMQSINIVVINPGFLGLFFGTAVAALGLAAHVLADWGDPAGLLLAGAAGVFLVGSFAVTLVGNVPLNEALAGLSPGTAEARREWDRYLIRWTRLNHVRTLSSLAAAILCIAGIAEILPA